MLIFYRERCERHFTERNREDKLDRGFCEGCPWLNRCGNDENDYPCHGSWDDVAYIDYGSQAINMDMDEEN